MALKTIKEAVVIIKEISSLWSLNTQEEQNALLLHVNIRKFKRNELIYSDLQDPTQMMYLVQGKVKIYKDGIGGRNQILRVIKPTECFGYRAFFAEESYRTAAMALEPCTVAFFPINIIIRLMKENPNISFFFLRHLAKELGNSDERTVSLTQKHIRGRLAEALLFLRNSYGLEEDGFTLSIYMSREDLAGLSNMTTSNAIRTLSAFASEKIISIDGKKIKLIRQDELLRISCVG